MAAPSPSGMGVPMYRFRNTHELCASFMYAAGQGSSMPMEPVTVPLLKYAVVVA